MNNHVVDTIERGPLKRMPKDAYYARYLILKLYLTGIRKFMYRLMAQSQCRRSVGDKFWPGVVIENKESLNNRSNNPNKSRAVILSEIFKGF